MCDTTIVIVPSRYYTIMTVCGLDFTKQAQTYREGKETVSESFMDNLLSEISLEETTIIITRLDLIASGFCYINAQKHSQISSK